MLRLRALQDETGGFQTFIPLAFHPDNNALMKLPGPTGVEDLRTYAVARLLLHNIPHIKAYWIMLGVKTAQTALWFGADDLDGTVQEEKHLPHGRRRDAAGDAPDGDRAPHPERRPHAGRARHALQRGRRGGGAGRPTSRSAATSAAAWRSSRERAQEDPPRRRLVPERAPHHLRPRARRWATRTTASSCRSTCPRAAPSASPRATSTWASSRSAPTPPAPTSCASCPGIAIASHGPVRTVLLVGEVPWTEMQEIALDGASRSSAMLLKLLCHERGLTPALPRGGARRGARRRARARPARW